jgi:hypothetical protein
MVPLSEKRAYIVKQNKNGVGYPFIMEDNAQCVRAHSGVSLGWVQILDLSLTICINFPL